MSGYLQGDASRREDELVATRDRDEAAAISALNTGYRGTPEVPEVPGYVPATQPDLDSRALSIAQGSTDSPLMLGESVPVLGGRGAPGTEGTPGTAAIPGGISGAMTGLRSLPDNRMASRMLQSLQMKQIEAALKPKEFASTRNGAIYDTNTGEVLSAGSGPDATFTSGIYTLRDGTNVPGKVNNRTGDLVLRVDGVDVPAPTGTTPFRAPGANADGNGPMSIQEWNIFQKMTPAQKEEYLLMKRSNNYINLGDLMVRPNITEPGANAVMQKGVPPEAQPELKGEQAAAVASALSVQKKLDSLPKAQSALVALTRQSSVVTTTIDSALSLAKNEAATGLMGAVLSNFPNTDARALANDLKTIRANIGFDKLDSIRSNAITGGALGNVSDYETKLLQAVNGALDPLQKDQLVQNLTAIKKLYPQVLAERERAFQQDYGDVLSANKTPPSKGTRPLPKGVNETDIEATMSKHGLTRDQVLDRLESGGR